MVNQFYEIIKLLCNYYIILVDINNKFIISIFIFLFYLYLYNLILNYILIFKLA